jgi:hypothetical protein
MVKLKKGLLVPLADIVPDPPDVVGISHPGHAAVTLAIGLDEGIGNFLLK